MTMGSLGHAIRLDYAPRALDGNATVVDVLRQILVSGMPEKGGFSVAELRDQVHILNNIDRALSNGAAEVRLPADAWMFLCQLIGGCTFSEARPVFLAAVDAVLEAPGCDASEPGIEAVAVGAS